MYMCAIVEGAERRCECFFACEDLTAFEPSLNSAYSSSVIYRFYPVGTTVKMTPLTMVNILLTGVR